MPSMNYASRVGVEEDGIHLRCCSVPGRIVAADQLAREGALHR